MALSATMRRFEIALADADRAIYTELDLRVAQHPSESERYLVTRVVARALEDAEGLEFSKLGVSDDTEPALVQRDLRGDLLAWIEIGSPTPDRLHKAAKAHRGDEIIIVGLPAEFLDGAATTLDRVNRWDLSVTGGSLYLTINERLFEATVLRA